MHREFLEQNWGYTAPDFISKETRIKMMLTSFMEFYDSGQCFTNKMYQLQKCPVYLTVVIATIVFRSSRIPDWRVVSCYSKS